MCSDHTPYRILPIIAVLALALQGCGHKGPLMLPAPPVPVSGVQAPPAQAADQQKASLPSAQQTPTNPVKSTN